VAAGATHPFDGLGLRRGDVVAVAGAGGKTALILALATEAARRGLRALVTTTTHMGFLPEAEWGPAFVEEDGDPAPALRRALDRERRATLLGRRVRPDKLEGVPPARVDALAGLADLLLVEADGARGRSLKVPAPHEPVVPRSTTLLVVVAALDVLGAPLDAERVHRPERVSEVTGWPAGTTLGERDVAACLLHRPGYPDHLPRAGRGAVFLNKAEDDRTRAAAARIARSLVPPYERVLAGSARGQVRVIAP
jgi:probable selenium-dependent hydroxylase accessory protein YqeC